MHLATSFFGCLRKLEKKRGFATASVEKLESLDSSRTITANLCNICSRTFVQQRDQRAEPGDLSSGMRLAA